MKVPRISDQLAIDFNIVLSASMEEEIHRFMAAHTQLFSFLAWDGIVRSKFRLAECFVPDFLVLGLHPYSNSPCPMATFIEIERADIPLFTRGGNPSASLTHALRQVQDWKSWTKENRNYLRGRLQQIVTDEMKRLPEIDRNCDLEYNEFSQIIRCRQLEMDFSQSRRFMDTYVVVIGRRNTLTMPELLRLSHMNDDLKGIKIITYDAILEGIVRHISSTRQGEQSDCILIEEND